MKITKQKEHFVNIITKIRDFESAKQGMDAIFNYGLPKDFVRDEMCIYIRNNNEPFLQNCWGEVCYLKDGKFERYYHIDSFYIDEKNIRYEGFIDDLIQQFKDGNIKDKGHLISLLEIVERYNNLENIAVLINDAINKCELVNKNEQKKDGLLKEIEKLEDDKDYISQQLEYLRKELKELKNIENKED